MFVFAEILAADRSGAERDYLRELSRPGVDLQPLETGTLREQDAERMMDRIRRDFPQAPELPEHLFQKYLVTLVNADHHPMTAKALAMEACAYLAEAEAEGAQRVTEDHLIRYYQRLARELSRREGS
jgi:hypothetical protein